MLLLCIKNKHLAVVSRGLCAYWPFNHRPLHHHVNTDLPASVTDILPPPKLEHLPALAQAMEALAVENKRNAAAEILRQSEYIGELLDIFSTVEDLEDQATCTLLFKIFNCMGQFAARDPWLWR